jgi:hypothetical protein
MGKNILTILAVGVVVAVFASTSALAAEEEK